MKSAEDASHNRECPSLSLAGAPLPENIQELMGGAWSRALSDMAELEAGQVANRSESRAVGHYWLRSPERAPAEANTAILQMHEAVDSLAESVAGGLTSTHGTHKLKTLVVCGIGGSALGPELLLSALAPVDSTVKALFLDNIDPDGLAGHLNTIAARGVDNALCLVISKSGRTQEMRTCLAALKSFWKEQGRQLEAQAIAISTPGSALWKTSATWHSRIPLWDWVGGRTSFSSAVGLVPCALLGLDWRALLAGAAEMDRRTRSSTLTENPAGRLACAWLYWSRNANGKLADTRTWGQGGRSLVVLPYRDRLILLGRYLQQLVMESLGKARSHSGEHRPQGLVVYGNKGTTDQHAFVQQLRDGHDDSLVCFVAVLSGREGDSPHQAALRQKDEHGQTAADYLNAFYLGTRVALEEAGRPCMTIAMPQLEAYQLGALLALHERAVSFYASFVDINAYDQPGVEAGKLAAKDILALQGHIAGALKKRSEETVDAAGIHRELQGRGLAGPVNSPRGLALVQSIIKHLEAGPHAKENHQPTPRNDPAQGNPAGTNHA